ncbi:MAG: hypothetical protein ACTSPA_13560 [Promethearchaeota archaeon]
MLDSYVAGARGALLLYDMTRLRTLDGLDEWVKIVRTHDPDLPILFVGTKLDRVEDITVSDDYAKEFLEPLNMFEHMKISSKNGVGVEQAFKKITRKVLEINGVYVPPEAEADTVPQQPEITPVSEPSTIPAPISEPASIPPPVYEPPTISAPVSEPTSIPPPVYEPPTISTPVSEPTSIPPPVYEPPTIPAPVSEPPVIEPAPTEEPEEKKKPKKDPEEDFYSYFTKTSS